MSKTWDVILIGAGIAGLQTALYLAEANLNVLIVYATEPELSSSFLAQGGIAVASSPEDSAALHAKDTLAAGQGLSDQPNVHRLTQESKEVLKSLLDAGLFMRKQDNTPDLALEAAHTLPRIWHAQDGRTGREVMRYLWQQVRQKINIDLYQGRVIHLVQQQTGAIQGVQLVAPKAEPRILRAPHVVIASGGYTGLFAKRSNPQASLGDGLILAWQVGAALADLEFVQFHPTVYTGPNRTLLLTEALRGLGAHLIDQNGKRFMMSLPRAELEPRDIVSRYVSQQAKAFLFLQHVPSDLIMHHFSYLLHTLAEDGLDLRKDPIPVAPAAHFSMGGIITDASGRTNVPGLWAVGEVADTGVHGANRLASNALLEGLVFGRRAARNIIQSALPLTDGYLMPTSSLNWHMPTGLQAQMTNHLGILRTKDSLESLKNELQYDSKANGYKQLAQLITEAALLREESRGSHYREDFPHVDLVQKGHYIFRKNHEPTFQERLG